MNFIENIKNKNQFPILFIGAGLTKRYFSDAPSWSDLLMMLWNEVFEPDGFDRLFNKLHRSEKKSIDETYLLIADRLENEIDAAFFDGRIEIDGITNKTVREQNLSPFRELIANKFKSLTPRPNLEEEKESLRQLLKKARFIITTNYDPFIETLLNNDVAIKIGNKGLFEHFGNYGELYKIHGCASSPASITITSDDYLNNESKLAIVNAKILSSLTNAPVLFFGYSLTDQNVKNLIQTYYDNFPEELGSPSTNIGVMVRTDDKEDIKYIVQRKGGSDMHVTEIHTDNYKLVYDEISSVEQGITPAEIMKFEQNLRHIIKIRGESGDAKEIFANIVDVSKMNDTEILNSRIVVGIGRDDDIITKWAIPKYKDYIINYFSESELMPAEVALNFILSQTQSPIPFAKHLDAIRALPGYESEKSEFEQRIKQYKNYLANFKGTKAPKKYKSILSTNHSAQEIYHLTDIFYATVKINYILSKFENYNKSDLDELIDHILINDISKIESCHRKLLMAYSLL